MSERDAFLRDIADHHADDTRRLAFADWLDENGDRPADAATAEFIRVACPAQTARKIKQTYREGRWVRDNWERLVPSLVARGAVLCYRDGRWIDAHAIDRVRLRGSKTQVRRWVRLEFWRGFVRHARFSSAEHCLELLPHLLADQPLAVPVVTGLKFDERADEEGAYVLVDAHDLGEAAGALRGFGDTFGNGHTAVYRDRNLVSAHSRARREVRAALLRKGWAKLAEMRKAEGVPA